MRGVVSKEVKKTRKMSLKLLRNVAILMSMFFSFSLIVATQLKRIFYFRSTVEQLKWVSDLMGLTSQVYEKGLYCFPIIPFLRYKQEEFF